MGIKEFAIQHQIDHLKDEFHRACPDYPYSDEIGEEVGWGLYKRMVVDCGWGITNHTRLQAVNTSTGLQRVGFAIFEGKWTVYVEYGWAHFDGIANVLLVWGLFKGRVNNHITDEQGDAHHG